ncbi:MAG: hypothetical protein IIY77_06070 [Lachnospiraceae bacterium]|nr:hypothetical protein [Lachnospiraceae bacterium]
MDRITVQWNGEDGLKWSAELGIRNGAPCFMTVGYESNGSLVPLFSDVTPQFKVITGKRTKHNPQRVKLLAPGEEPGYQWDTYSDDPMSRPQEVKEANERWNTTEIAYSRDNARQTVTFDGLTLGQFAGGLAVNFYEGSNLIKIEAVASTEEDGVAYLYHGGLKGFEPNKLYYVTPKRHECLENPGYHTNSGPDRDRQRVDARGRVLSLQCRKGAVAVMPTPHRFFWPCQTENIVGYNYYNLEKDNTLSIGVRHNKQQEHFNVRWPLYNAQPGTLQRMSFFLLVNSETVYSARSMAMRYTNFDHLRPLDGYKRLGSHMHIASQAAFARDYRKQRPWELLLKELGFDIFSPCDFWAEGRNDDNKEGRKADMERYALESRYVSTPDFLLVTGEELAVMGPDSSKQLIPYHFMIWPSKPLLYSRWRDDDQEFAEKLPDGRTYYHLKSAMDVIEMCRWENCFIQMPHPDTKANDGLPYDCKNEPWFTDERWIGIGCRMLPTDNSFDTMLDGRAERVWNDINNWADRPRYIMSELDTYSKVEEREEDWEVYSLTNCTYVQLDHVPSSDNWEELIDALREGRHFYSTGEILLEESRIEDGKAAGTFSWTFPLSYAECVYSDGEIVSKQRISLTDTRAYGRKTVEFTFPEGMKWARILATDIAGNSAFGMPVFLREKKN